MKTETLVKIIILLVFANVSFAQADFFSDLGIICRQAVKPVMFGLIGLLTVMNVARASIEISRGNFDTGFNNIIYAFAAVMMIGVMYTILTDGVFAPNVMGFGVVQSTHGFCR